MPIRMITNIANESFIPFSQWLDAKKAAALAANNTAEVNKINQALADKQNTLNVVNIIDEPTMSTTEYITVLDTMPDAVPDYSEYLNQWRAEYGVTVTYEEVHE
jgi:hypothetical protein